MATPKQTWALFCLTGLDCRGRLSLAQASMFLDEIKNGNTESAIRSLQKLGCTGTPKIKRDWRSVWDTAREAGNIAAEKCIPRPMTVVAHVNPLDDSSEVDKYWNVPDGVCGFAWVWMKGNSSFGMWAKKAGIARKSYPNGLSIWISEFGQSMEKKMAFAEAAAESLQSAGVKCYAQSRMD